MIFAFSLVAGHGQTAPATATGRVSGTVVNSKGKGVSATLQVMPPAGFKVIAATYADKDGAFAVSGLADGVYRICATPSAKGYIDSCVWGGGPIFRVSGGKSVTGKKLVLEDSATLQVHVDDPSGALTEVRSAAAVAADPIPTHLMVGVVTQNGLFMSLPVSGKSNNGRDHAAAVPADRKLTVRAISHGVAVQSALQGTGVAGTDFAVTLSSTKANAPVVLSVKASGK